MNIRGSYKRSAKLYSAWILLLLLTVSSGPVFTGRAQQAARVDASQLPLFTYADLDEDATKWGIFEENGNPISDISNMPSPSLDGRSLRCAILGGDIYSNVHCYRNLPAEPNSNAFLMSLSFYYRPDSSFNNANGVPSIVQGLEFTMNKWENGLRYEWALQWDNVDPDADPAALAPKWRYWDPANPNKWVDAGLPGGVNGMGWHTLVLEGGIFNGQVHYRRFVFDGQSFPLDVVVAPASAGEPDKLAVAVQLDGNYKEDPYELFIDDVTFVTGESFTDVPFHYWAFEWIQRLYGAGITGGCSTNPLAYCSEASVTRAQMAVFLEKGLHYPNAFTPPNVAPTFNDTVGHWAEDWIEALRNDGITGGCGQNLYCPENPVTRAEMAVFLLKAKYGAGYSPPPVGSSTGFNDVPTTQWAAAWIEQLSAEGITGGCGASNYCPNDPVTRAQMAVFLVRAFNLP